MKMCAEELRSAVNTATYVALTMRPAARNGANSSGRGQEIDGVMNGDRRDFFRTKVEAQNSLNNLGGQRRRFHIRGLQLAHRYAAIGFDGEL